jgi:hypothetical protein
MIKCTMTDDTSPYITYLPTPGDWALSNLQGAFNNTLQCALHPHNVDRPFVLMC